MALRLNGYGTLRLKAVCAIKLPFRFSPAPDPVLDACRRCVQSKTSFHKKVLCGAIHLFLKSKNLSTALPGTLGDTRKCRAGLDKEPFDNSYGMVKIYAKFRPHEVQV
jgi:hypothetical protein